MYYKSYIAYMYKCLKKKNHRYWESRFGWIFI